MLLLYPFGGKLWGKCLTPKVVVPVEAVVAEVGFMAQRDKSQGFGFVYVDLAKILADRDKLDPQSSQPFHPTNAPVINFNKDTNVRPVPAPAPVADAARDRSTAIAQIRENLDRLQSLHHKLHAMLEELNSVTDKKKR